MNEASELIYAEKGTEKLERTARIAMLQFITHAQYYLNDCIGHVTLVFFSHFGFLHEVTISSVCLSEEARWYLAG